MSRLPTRTSDPDRETGAGLTAETAESAEKPVPGRHLKPPRNADECSRDRLRLLFAVFRPTAG